MKRILLASIAVFLVMFVVPFPFYATFEALGWASLPEPESPGAFMLSVVVMKAGIALGFVMLYSFSAASWQGRRWAYAGIWWLMYAIIETGQAIGPGYGIGEAVAGVLSEAVYFPLSAWIVERVLRKTRLQA